ncbi:MAG: transcription-repair coupling factor [Nitrospirae bacterium]|nr:transcription-repair coupling factor [Nitrospirota bacterium]
MQKKNMGIKNIYEVKGAGPLARGSEGEQSSPFYFFYFLYTKAYVCVKIYIEMSIVEIIRDQLNACLPAALPRVFNLKGSLLPLFLTMVETPYILVTKTEDECLRILEQYWFYAEINGKHPLVYFPDAQDAANSGRQVEIIVNNQHHPSLITTLETLKKPLSTPDELRSQTLVLKTGSEISREDVVEILQTCFGYKRVAMVLQQGEFSLRNYILDLYPPSMEMAVRVEFFGDEIESIRFFCVDTQRTVRNAYELTLLPIQQAQGRAFLFDVFKIERIFFMDEVAVDAASFIDSNRQMLPQTILSRVPFEGEGVDAGSISMSGQGVLLEDRPSITTLPQTIQMLAQKHHIVIVCSTTAQAERLKDLFAESAIPVAIIKHEAIKHFDGNILITVGHLNLGLFIEGLLVLTERELFGDTSRHRSLRKATLTDIVRRMDDLNVGDCVVHEDHGIGVFEGLRKETIEGFVSDMLIVRYADEARLYIPAHGIGVLKKYYAHEGAIPRLDRLGGKTWQKAKKKVKGKVQELAAKLIRHYAERGMVEAEALCADGPVHTEFDNFFPYEPTPDQISAVTDIKREMESPTPMDRLLCGDVGYGKTEVAMRAAFKAVYDGRQVVILVPTTILCEQHYLNFKERFSPFPVSIDYISRFKPTSKINETLRRLAKGEIDIIIGTQGLLRKDLEVPALGLLVIDEEHRFGVAQKERIKEMKKGTHCLSLSATPIPRTLQMALSGIWTMSTLQTPPEDRQAVRTIICSFNSDVLKEALQREFDRNGQVFFVHNRIADIEKLAAQVKTLVPKATIAVAHGQMNERELEDIMVRFIKHDLDVLVSTSIIGSGIDIPSANTIIINRADMMGLADLYQLRGRVGRSNVRAYAYMFIPGEDMITEEAKKRLTALQELSYLGAGLKLAMKDMEIRGAGNILGAQQSGHIYDVGFDTYMDMLQEEIAQLRGLPIERETEPLIDLRVEAIIPDVYVEDVTLRLNFYRRIALSKTEDELFGLQDEMNDRFGRPPQRLINLFSIMRLKLLCRKVKASSIVFQNGYIFVGFAEEDVPSFERLSDVETKSKQKIRYSQKGFEVVIKHTEQTGVLECLIAVLKRLEGGEKGEERMEGFAY